MSSIEYFESFSQNLFIKLAQNVRRYLFDFLNLDDLLEIIHVNKNFRNYVTQHKQIQFFFSFLFPKIKKKQFYIDGLLYDSHAIDVPMDKLMEKNFMSRIFDSPLKIEFGDLNKVGFSNLSVILNSNFSQIPKIKLCLDSDEKKVFKYLIKYMRIQHFVSSLSLDGIKSVFVSTLSTYIKQTKIEHLSLKKWKGYTMYDFWELIEYTSITSLKLKNFTEKDVYAFVEYIKPSPIRRLDLSRSSELVTKESLSALNDVLIQINLCNKEINKPLKDSLVTLIESRKGIKRLYLSKRYHDPLFDKYSNIIFL